MKVRTSFALFLVLLALGGTALAGSIFDTGVQVTADLLGRNKSTVFPVYAAPSEEAWRGADGKAAVSLAEPFWAFAEYEDVFYRMWWLIEYAIREGENRVGWICLNPEIEPTVIPSAKWVDSSAYWEIAEGWRMKEDFDDFYGEDWLPEVMRDPEAFEAMRDHKYQPAVEGLWLANWPDLVLGEVTRDVTVTDDPRGTGRVIARLHAGDRIKLDVAGEYVSTWADSPWDYVLFEIDGKRAGGFIPSGAAQRVESLFHVEGTALVIEEGVDLLGEEYEALDGGGIYHYVLGPYWGMDTFGMTALNSDSGYGWYNGSDAQLAREVLKAWGEEAYTVFGEVTNRYTGERLPRVSWNGFGKSFTEIRLPSSLRAIGEDAFYEFDMDELVIPEGVQRFRGFACLYDCHIGTLKLPTTLKEYGYCTFTTCIDRYEVAPGSPYLKSVDGVLFTADGKTLLAYPGGKPDIHYEVPAGVEVIARGAFPSYTMYSEGSWYWKPVPLKTLGLPIGLKRIEGEALRSLDELISIVIPPTVTYCPREALSGMGSLTQVSAPEHLHLINDTDEYHYMAYEEERTGKPAYTGDNGPAIAEKEEGYWW